MVINAVYLAETDNPHIKRVFEDETRMRLTEKVSFHPEYINRQNLDQYRDKLRNVGVAFSTWGMPGFSEGELQDFFPNLKILFYAAGSVQRFARPFLSRDITIVSSWAANAVPVSEYVTAQILLANKGYFLTSRLYKKDYAEAKRALTMFPGNYQARVGIIGAGMIGRMVIGQLRNYNIQLDVFDPFLSDEAAKHLGVHKTDLIQLFSRCDTISNHVANLPETVGMINKEHFDRMLPHATFINTGRGAQLVEQDLIRALKEVPTRSAVLDVTNPEPVLQDSELLQLDNVILTPHIAGSMGLEVARMGIYAVEEFERYLRNEPLRYAVTGDMLATMA
jgi:phosphoglycerate dehydrogenase-like enzyme